MHWHWPVAPTPSEVEQQIDVTLSHGIGGLLIDAPTPQIRGSKSSENWMASLVTVASRARKLRDSVWINDDLGTTNYSMAQDRIRTERAQQYTHITVCPLSAEAISDASTQRAVARFLRTSDRRCTQLQDTEGLIPNEDTLLWTFQSTVDETLLRFLHAKTIRQHLDERYSPIQVKTKRFFGNTLGVILANNAQLKYGDGIFPWDKDFAEVFEQVFNYDLRPHLMDLIQDGPDSALHRSHYWQLVADLFREGFAYTMKGWGDEHKVPCAGYFPDSASLCDQVQSTGPRMPLYAQQLYPTVVLTPGLTQSDQSSAIVNLKQVVSTVHQIDTRGAIGLFTAPTTPLSLEEWHNLLIWHLAIGITYFAFDGTHHSADISESTKLPHMNPMDSGWPFMAEHFDGLARLAWMYRRGESVCHVLFLLPTTSIQSGYRVPIGDASINEGCSHIDTHLKRLSEELLKHQIDFDFGDESLLALHAHANHNSICMGPQSYQAVLLPPTTAIRSSTFALLQDFATSGGHILTAGTVPHLLDGVVNLDLEKFFDEYAHRITSGIDLFDYSRVIDTLTKWDCRIVNAQMRDSATSAGLLARQRHWEECEILQLTYTDAWEEHLDIQFTPSISGHVEVWDYRTGAMIPVSNCSAEEPFQIQDTFQPHESRIYVFLPDALEDSPDTGSGIRVERRVDLQWTGTRLDHNTVALAHCRFDGHAWENLKCSREILQHRLDTMPEGVIGTLYWSIHVPAHLLSSPQWTVTLPIPKGATIRCDGQVLEAESTSAVRHPRFGTYRLPESVPENAEIAIEGKWLSVRDIDSPIVGGDFSLKDGMYSNASRSTPLGTWANVGLPTYSGRVLYQAELQGYERFDPSPILLEMDGLRSPAEVRVNGRIVRHILQQPYRCDIRSVWSAGPLHIEIEVAGSWYNALHPDEPPIAQGLSEAPFIEIYATK